MGVIDAYSRMVMYLTCSDNNRGSYVLSSFSKAVHENGLQTHVRSDLVGRKCQCLEIHGRTTFFF